MAHSVKTLVLHTCSHGYLSTLESFNVEPEYEQPKRKAGLGGYGP